MTADAGRPATLVFSDLRGSTALGERLDPESLRTLLTGYFDAARGVVEARGGRVTKIIGDAVVAVFDGSDDPEGAARRAVLAVADARRALDAANPAFERRYGVRLENRTGIASGVLSAADVEAASEAEVLAGDVVAVAESLEQAAPTDGALLDAATLALLGGTEVVRAHEAVPRRGRDERVEAWELVIERPEVDADDGEEPLDLDVDLDEDRRTVTILFADPKPTAAEGRALDGVERGEAMGRYFEVVAPILERHGATVEKFIGDAVMAVFGLPVRREDDAARALRAAAEVQAAVADLVVEGASGAVRFANPIGVNTGPVVASDGSSRERLVTGDAVNVAARLEQAAGPGEVVVGGLTAQLAGATVELEAIEPLALKGKAEPVPAHRLVRVRAEREAQRHDLPLIGRDRELAQLHGALARASERQRPVRATVVGDAGLGKSRLVEEFLARADARVLSGNCLAYGDGITFWPLLRIVQGAAGVVEDDEGDVARAKVRALAVGDGRLADRLVALAGLADVPFSVGELTWAMGRLLERLAADGPTIVLIDDVHWAEPTLFEVLDEVEAATHGPLLVLLTARPALLAEHPDVVAHDDPATVLLGPLTAEHGERFLRLLLGDAAVDPAALARIVDAAAGNPLFLEQLLSMLVDEGRLERTGSGWRLRDDLASLVVPASVEALLAARLDRLPPEGRRTIGPASVIGRHVVVDALEHLVDPDLRPQVDVRLADLRDRDLMVPVDGSEPAVRFQHQLIRDATYQSLLKRARATLHERFVAWAEARNSERDREAEFDEILGYHLEAAHRYRSELGPQDAAGTQLATRGAAHLVAAGRRALARGDVAAAANLLPRAAALLPEDHPDRPDHLLLAGSALHETGAFDDAIATYEAAATAAAALDDDATAIAGRIAALRLRYLSGRADDVDEVSAAVEAALAAVAERDAPAAASRAWQLQLNLHIAACRWEGAGHAAEQVVANARRAGDHLLAVRTLPLLAFLAQKGPTPVGPATERAEQILREVGEDRRSASLVQLELALLDAMGGELERARARCAETRRALVELGWEMQAALVSLSSGPIELLADEPARAEAELRRDYEALDRMDERNFISLTAVLLAEAVIRQGRDDEAAALVERSAEIAAPDDVAVQILLASVSAKLASRRGERAVALAKIDEAHALMAATEDPSGLGDVLLDRAEVLAALADLDGADAALAEAQLAYRRKGNQLGDRRVDAARARLGLGS